MIFATEFPVSQQFDRGRFIATIVSWLRGTTYSRIFDDKTSYDLDGSSADLKSDNGETLTLRELNEHPRFEAIGFRHDNPDGNRLWRTEGVLRRDRSGNNGLFRIKTQCIATAMMEETHFPRKPYLIKTLIQDGNTGLDGLFEVSDKPVHLGEQDLDLAQAIVSGDASNYLPVAYISAATGQPALSGDDIAKLAYDLGGIAHVVVEPSRNFSFALRDRANGKNVYGGYAGIFMPGQGLQVRIAPESGAAQFREKIRRVGASIRSQIPQTGWDWVDFQEENFRTLRQREKNKLSAEQMEEIYTQEIKTKDEQIKTKEELIRDLQSQLAQRRVVISSDRYEGEMLNEAVQGLIGPEVYEGEFSDRVRYAVHLALTNAEAQGIDKRTQVVLNLLLKNTAVSQELGELRDELRRSGKDAKKAAESMQRLLARHGYSIKGDNKHIRLEAAPGYMGLESITLPKTPSDARGPKNMISDIENAMGLNRLDTSKEEEKHNRGANPAHKKQAI